MKQILAVKRSVAVCVLLVLASPALAQFTPDAQQVARFAPQLTAFAGSPSNFESLASGLVAGGTVRLTTTGSDGTRETATFQAAQPLPPLEAARLLEAARQSLIMRGVGSPSAQQIAVVLMGGTLVTASGKFDVPALVQAADPKSPFSVVTASLGGSAANFKSLSDGLAAGTRVTMKNPDGSETAFTPPGGAMSAQEVSQTLALASQLLAQQGIHHPTPEQLRAAILGGRIVAASGSAVQLRGVMEGRSAATSASRAGSTSASPESAPTSATRVQGTTSSTRQPGTSDSRPGGTSDSRVFGTSNTPQKK